jgi:hypothetical protein
VAQQNYHYPKYYLINSVFLNPSLLFRFKWVLVKFYFIYLNLIIFIFIYYSVAIKNNFLKIKNFIILIYFLIKNIFKKLLQ